MRNSLKEIVLKKLFLQFYQSPLTVLEAPIVFFPPKTPHKASRNHLPNYIKLKPTTNYFPTSKKIYHPTMHNPSQLYTAEHIIPQSTGNLTME
jgi:hypothetical protein